MAKKPKKEVKPVLKLEKELLICAIAYNDFNEQKKDMEDLMKPLKEKIIKMLSESDATKAMSQVYLINWSHIKTKKLSEKKLKEELFVRGDEKLYNSCLYDLEYDRLTVKKRKGGENIF